MPWSSISTIYSTSAYGGTDPAVGSTEQNTQTVDHVTGDYRYSEVTVDATFVATPTDNLVVKVYGSLDGTNFDLTPLYSFEVDKGTSPNRVTFEVRNVPYFRLGLVSSGTTDTIDVQVTVRSWKR